jgi:pyruvate/2-oxoglutarate/acetoin dehydrogenase E1 component
MDVQINYFASFEDAIIEEARKNPRIFVMGEDISSLTLKRFSSEFPNRVFNTPISENGFMGVGLGAALTGMKPIVFLMFIDLSPLAMEQINNQIAKARYMFGGKLKVPIIIVLPEGASGMAAGHHSQSLDAWFIHIPGLKVIAPSTPYDAKGLMKTALNDDNPIIVLQHKVLRILKGYVPNEEYTIPFGQAIVKREGNDVTIVAWLNMVHKALRAAEILEEENISAEVVDPRTLVPFDEETVLRSIEKTGRLVVAEEECKRGGAAAEVVAMVAEKGFQHLKSPIIRVAAKDAPIPYARVLERFVLPQVEDIVKAVKEIVP